MTQEFFIEERLIKTGRPVYIIAELSANHCQDFERAASMIHAAKVAGADAIKLQTLSPDTITCDCDNELFRVGGGTLWDGRTLYDLYAEAQTPWEWQPKLKKIANELGMDLFSSSFSPEAVDFLESIDVPIHKIASYELVDIPLIQYMARTGKPIILSTGMASVEEIEEAVEAATKHGSPVALLLCTSGYPTPPEEMNLNSLHSMREYFELPVGLSDHTTGIEVPIAAVALGACIVEKHFTLSREKGLDKEFSLEPDEFATMVNAIRITEKAIAGSAAKTSEKPQKLLRRSLFVIQDMAKGEVFTVSNVRSIRPAYGLPPKHLQQILGQKATVDIKKGTPMNWSLVG